MSKAIPRRTIDALRANTKVTLDILGIDCDLYILQNTHDMALEGVYAEPDDAEYIHYTTSVWIEWMPTKYRLTKLGVYVEEDEMPILIRLPNQATKDSGALVNIDIVRRSYFKIDPEYIPSNITNPVEFELTAAAIDRMHDAALTKIWKAVPRAVEQFIDDDEML